MGSRRVGVTRRDILRAVAASLDLGLPARPVRPADGDEDDVVITAGDPDAATRDSVEVMGPVRTVQSERQWPENGNRLTAHQPDLRRTDLETFRTTSLRPIHSPEAGD